MNIWWDVAQMAFRIEDGMLNKYHLWGLMIGSYDLDSYEKNKRGNEQ